MSNKVTSWTWGQISSIRVSFGRRKSFCHGSLLHHQSGSHVWTRGTRWASCRCSVVALCPAAAFLTQTVCLDDTTVKFEIWDTAGQERYHSLAPMYYRGAQAAIVVYDITNEVSWVLLPLNVVTMRDWTGFFFFFIAVRLKTEVCWKMTCFLNKGKAENIFPTKVQLVELIASQQEGLCCVPLA